MNASRWKLLFQSVRGTGHVRAGQPCQDACLARLAPSCTGPTLLLACADGAGSAAHSATGARLACRQLLRFIQADLADNLPVEWIDRDTVLSWYLRVRRVLEEEAARLEVAVGQLATTLLVALLGENAAVFGQVGDGVIVTRDGDDYAAVFWPQSGEYINTTNFVTDADLEANVAFDSRSERVEEAALLSDGLQGLALHYASRRTHQPFFAPLFARLRNARPGEGLALALRRFLDGEAVNARTDDDKTLILATRMTADAAARAV